MKLLKFNKLCFHIPRKNIFPIKRYFCIEHINNNTNIILNNEKQDTTIMEHVDTSVSNTIDKATSALNYSSSCINTSVEFAGSVVNGTIDSFNDNIVNNIPNIIDPKLPTNIKLLTESVCDASHTGKHMLKQIIGSIGYLGKFIGRIMGDILKKYFPKSNNIQSKSLNSLKNFASQSANNVINIMDTIDNTTNDITLNIRNTGEQTMTRAFGTDIGSISKDLLVVGENFIHTKKMLKGLTAQKIVKDGLNSAAKETIKEATLTYLDKDIIVVNPVDDDDNNTDFKFIKKLSKQL